MHVEASRPWLLMHQRMWVTNNKNYILCNPHFMDLMYQIENFFIFNFLKNLVSLCLIETGTYTLFSRMVAETEVRKTERDCLHFLCSAMNASIVCIEMFSRKNGNVGNCRAASRNRLADFLIAFSHLFDVIVWRYRWTNSKRCHWIVSIKWYTK